MQFFDEHGNPLTPNLRLTPYGLMEDDGAIFFGNCLTTCGPSGIIG